MVRLTEPVRQELEAMALADQCSVSSVANRILTAFIVSKTVMERRDVRR
jgi:hypothetical protein